MGQENGIIETEIRKKQNRNGEEMGQEGGIIETEIRKKQNRNREENGTGRRYN